MKLQLTYCHLTNSILIVSLLLSFSSCKKGCNDPYARNYNKSVKKNHHSLCNYGFIEVKDTPYQPFFEIESATLIRIQHEDLVYSGKYYYLTPNFDYYAFFTTNKGASYIPCGELTFSDYKYGDTVVRTLPLRLDNSYSSFFKLHIYGASGLTPQIKWTGSGGAWPAFTVVADAQLPKATSFSSHNPKLNSEYVLTVSGVADADSILYEIYGQQAILRKMSASSQYTHAFLKDEINSLGFGPAVIKIIALKYDKQVVDGKTYNLVFGKDLIGNYFVERN